VSERINPKHKNIFMKLMICLNIDEMIKTELLIGERYGEIG